MESTNYTSQTTNNRINNNIPWDKFGSEFLTQLNKLLHNTTFVGVTAAAVYAACSKVIKSAYFLSAISYVIGGACAFYSYYTFNNAYKALPQDEQVRDKFIKDSAGVMLASTVGAFFGIIIGIIAFTSNDKDNKPSQYHNRSWGGYTPNYYNYNPINIFAPNFTNTASNDTYRDNLDNNNHTTNSNKSNNNLTFNSSIMTCALSFVTALSMFYVYKTAKVGLICQIFGSTCFASLIFASAAQHISTNLQYEYSNTTNYNPNSYMQPGDQDNYKSM